MPWPDCAPCHSLPDGGGGNRPPSGQPNVPANSRQSGLRVALAASSPRYLALTNIRRRSQSLPAATPGFVEPINGPLVVQASSRGRTSPKSTSISHQSPSSRTLRSISRGVRNIDSEMCVSRSRFFMGGPSNQSWMNIPSDLTTCPMKRIRLPTTLLVFRRRKPNAVNKALSAA